MPLTLLLPTPMLLLLLRRQHLPVLAQQVALPPRLGPRRDAICHVVDDGGTVHGGVEIRGSDLCTSGRRGGRGMGGDPTRIHRGGGQDNNPRLRPAYIGREGNGALQGFAKSPHRLRLQLLDLRGHVQHCSLFSWYCAGTADSDQASPKPYLVPWASMHGLRSGPPTPCQTQAPASHPTHATFKHSPWASMHCDTFRLRPLQVLAFAAPVLFFLVASALLPGPAAIGSTASVANGAAPPVWGTTVRQREKR